MRKNEYLMIKIISLLGSLIIIGQALFIYLKGEAFCLNQGCKIVESLTQVSPLYFNLIGFAYFQTLFWLAFAGPSKAWASYFLRIALLSGLAIEGTLIGYQTFVAHTFCSYCLFIFCLVAILNACAGLKHLFGGIGIFMAQIAIFSMLSFDTGKNVLAGLTLDDGTFAIRSCSEPEKRLYLLFSEDCPHCKNVLRALQGCTRCEFHFNPVSRIDSLMLPDIQPNPSYKTEVNVITLKMLGINAIPVLIDKRDDGMIFVKGDKNIIEYIEKSCFPKNVLLEQEEFLLQPSDDGVCSELKSCE